MNAAVRKTRSFLVACAAATKKIFEDLPEEITSQPKLDRELAMKGVGVPSQGRRPQPLAVCLGGCRDKVRYHVFWRTTLPEDRTLFFGPGPALHDSEHSFELGFAPEILGYGT